LYKKKLSTKS